MKFYTVTRYLKFPTMNLAGKERKTIVRYTMKKFQIGGFSLKHTTRKTLWIEGVLM